MSLRRSCLLAAMLVLGTACVPASSPSGGGSGGSGANAGTAATGGAAPAPDRATGGTGGSRDGAGGGGAAIAGSTGIAGNDANGGTGAGGAAATDDASAIAPAADAAADGSNSSSAGDDPPDRPLAIEKTAGQLFTIKFKPSEADPATVDNDALQTAFIDTRSATIRAKLVITLGGTNNPPGPLGLASYAAGLGFHVFAVAYHNGYSPVGSDPQFFGDARFDEFDGMGRNKSFKVARADSVEVRVTKALGYLQAKNPQGDWGYYLKKDGQVRWSDVIFFGQSHGATSAAAFAKLRRVWRAVSMSGPRDTTPVVASWLTLPSPTPIDRYYGFTGTGDGQHKDHIKAMEVMGYLGTLVDTSTTKAPYGGSHRLQYNGSHTADLTCAPFADPCQYMLGTLAP
jgi:hypothetical protein